jgi:hypothetical protein
MQASQPWSIEQECAKLLAEVGSVLCERSEQYKTVELFKCFHRILLAYFPKWGIELEDVPLVMDALKTARILTADKCQSVKDSFIDKVGYSAIAYAFRETCLLDSETETSC